MSNETPYKTLIIPDQQTQSNIVNFLVRKRPLGWGRRSYATYYKRIYADWIKVDIDDMIAKRASKIYLYSLWPKISRRSLYARVNQAILYLLDEANGMDLDGKYATWKENTRIRIRQEGIILEYMLSAEIELHAQDYTPERDKPKWRQKMDDWLENRDNTIPPFHQGGLILSPEEIAEIKETCEGLDGAILYEITSRDIKLIKV